MKPQHMILCLTACNLALIALLLGRGLPPAVADDMVAVDASTGAASEVTPVLRGRALELVDERGQVRSRLNIESDGAVVLRLIDRNGTIRVKLGADEGGSGLLLLDEDTEPGVHLIARRTGTVAKPTTRVTLRGGDGQERVITP